MAGHSKWANIKHRKAAQDAKKGKAFTRVAKEIMLAAKNGGDPDMNPRLRTALAAARAVNLPKDKIETAIKKGTGELQAETMEEIVYEGYGPAGVAVMVEVATDNRNRTVAEIRHIFSKAGGNLGETGSVNWMFDKKGILIFPKEGFDEDQLMEAGLEAGAEDVITEDDAFEVHTAPEDFHAVQQAFDDAGLAYASAEVTLVPQNTVDLDKDTAEKVLRLIDNLEDNDDVQNVSTNADFPDEVLEAMG
jgi:YebC/PmpR family DNA-binding regulatory protein